MGVGVGLAVVVVGAVLLWGADLPLVGGIVLAIGGVGLVLSLAFWSTWGGVARRETAVDPRRRQF